MNNYNNNFYGQNPAFGYGYQNGYGYKPTPLPNPTNPLSPEEIALLKQKSPAFSLAVDRLEALQAICTHRDKTGDKLIYHNDGTLECTLCGTKFRPAQAPQETIEGVFNEVVDILETMKTMYVDIPDDVARGIFQMIPYLKKCPKLWSIANDHYSRYAGNSVLSNRDYNSGNVMNMFAAMMNPMAGMNPGAAMYNQPAYGQPMYGNPMMGQPQQAPVPDVTMGAANNGVNPFDAGSTQQPTQQVTDNKQFNL